MRYPSHSALGGSLCDKRIIIKVGRKTVKQRGLREPELRGGSAVAQCRRAAVFATSA